MIDRHVVEALAAAAAGSDPADLARGALLIPRIEYRALDPAPTLGELERLGAAARDRLARLGATAGPADRIAALSTLLVEDEGFTGNTRRYEDPRNSFLNEVVARRTGIPITLSLVYIDVARRAGLPLEGVNFPGHFLVRYREPHGHRGRREEFLIDPFHGGAQLSESDCRQLLRRHVGDEAALEPGMLALATTKDVLTRMVVNLKRQYVAMRSFPQARAAVDLLLGLDPQSATERRDRGLLSYHLGDHAAALRDLEAFLERTAGRGAADAGAEDEAAERQQIWEHVKTLRRRIGSFN